MSMPYNPWGQMPPQQPPPPPGIQPTYAAMAAAQPTAYTPVQVRQTLGYSAPQVPPPPQYVNYTQYPQQHPVIYQPPPPQPKPIEKKEIVWPDSLRNYVGRAMSQTDLHDISAQEIKDRLFKEINAARETDQIDTINWDNYPLPQALIRMEREAQREPAGVWIGGRYVPNPSSAKKRKSMDDDSKNNGKIDVSVPWRMANNAANSAANSFENRITYVANDAFGKKQLPDGLPSKASKKQQNLEKRQRRFDGSYKSTYQRTPTPDPDSGPVVGRCQKLEKKYFRLTSAPNPDHVRPEPVLKDAFVFLKKKWKAERNYSYICDQFKSLRQDLTVQHITNEFTVEVYEMHARIALEKGDLGEYNQCQTQLRALYAKNLGGHPIEFKAYRILYFIHTCNRTALNDVLAELTPAEKAEPVIKHALDVRSALALGNYHKFFRLYLDTPLMGGYLMDMFVDRERLVALANICKAYKPDVKLRFVTEELGFESDGQAVEFICSYEGGKDLLAEREDGAVFFSGKAGQLFEQAKSGAFRKIDIKGQI